MSTALNLLAVQNAAVLRALEARPAEGWSNYAELANHLQRDPSNLSKTLKKLEDEGLAAFNPLAHGLTLAGQQQLAMIDKAEGNTTGDEPGSSSGAIVWLRHAEIAPDPDNARRDWDSDDAHDHLDALRSDIIQNGLLQNMVVRAPETEGQPHILVGGERRWRAIGIAISDGDIEPDTPYACRLLETDDLGVRLAALAENLQRRNLNPIEKARAFEGLAEAGLSNKEIADRVSSTPEHIQQHRRFLQLDETDQQRMTLAKDDPSHLSVREARQKLARKGEEEAARAEEAKTEADIATVASPEAWLTMAEFFHRLPKEATYTYADLVVGAEARGSTIAAELVALGWLDLSDMPRGYGQLAGHYTARLRQPVPQLFDWQWSSSSTERDAGLAAVYAKMDLKVEGGQYLTLWLRPNPALTEDGQALADAAEQHRANIAAENKRQEAENAARKERWAKARANHAALLTPQSGLPLHHTQAVTKEAATAVDHPLPWSLNHDGDILDANSQCVTSIGGDWRRADDQDLTLGQIIILSVNTAAGLETPPIISTAEAQEADGEGETGEDAA
ncbi:ParB N-terminal domain-containing protein [Brevundimonas sp.]|uniref:ParB N-terminal domain-containing protein n=1 Tax=Brevundimonas sp. TaxID=1871086 RepID=UPI00289C5121|nr:ParB N-terminal domain-containing protein [Brevundimonas sp.]